MSLFGIDFIFLYTENIVACVCVCVCVSECMCMFLLQIWNNESKRCKSWVEKCELWNTMEYLALKRKEILTHVKTWMNFEDIMLSEIRQSQKIQIMYDATYMKYLCQIHRQKVERCFPRAKGKGEWLVQWVQNFSFIRWESSGDWLHSNMNLFHATELYSWKWLRYKYYVIYFLPYHN